MRRPVLLILTLLLALAVASSPVAATPPLNRLGVHLLLDDGRGTWPIERWAEHLYHARQAVGAWGYVTQLVRRDDLSLARWQYFMDVCAALELTPVIRLATTFDRSRGWWRAPQRDPDGTYRTVAAEYAAFIGGLRWPTDRHYVIVGNEPNHGNEWGGRPDPAAYARFLVDVAAALHEADPQVQILNAGFDHYAPHTGSFPFSPGGAYFMDAETFMDEMVAAIPDVFTVIDVWSSHPYPAGPFTEGPWVQTFRRDLINDARNPAQMAPVAGVFNRGVNGYDWEILKLFSYGIVNLPILITETGWRKAESTHPRALDGGRGLPPASTVAAYIDLTLNGNNGRYPQYPETGWRPWLDDPNVIGVTFFAFNGKPEEWGHTNWLMLDADGAVRGAYPMAEMLAAISQRQAISDR